MPRPHLRLLSLDLPRSRVLTAMLIVILLVLALAPFALPGVKALSVAAKILVFIVLVASFDLLLGYTGIVSFAHTMFFGIGAYGVAIAVTRWAPTGRRWRRAPPWRCYCPAAGSGNRSLFAARPAIFFAMITLAIASAFQTLASQLPDFTGGEDGLNSSCRNYSGRVTALPTPPFSA